MRPRWHKLRRVYICPPGPGNRPHNGTGAATRLIKWCAVLREGYSVAIYGENACRC